MDFFSLFDPSEGSQSSDKTKSQQDTVKKKTEGKGRRRTRRPQVTSECTESEESSFLCEPALSAVSPPTAHSYIDSYLEHDSKLESDKRPRHRNPSHKTRRKSLTDDRTSDPEAKNSWNNKKIKPSVYDENIGKNVNDLKNNNGTFTVKKDNNDKDKAKKESLDTFSNEKQRNDIKNDNYTKVLPDNKNVETNDNFEKFCNEKRFDDFSNEVNKIFNKNIHLSEKRKGVNNLIEKLDRVKIIDDLYVSGDLKEEHLYNTDISDDIDSESDSDSSSNSSADSNTIYGRLPPEPRFGNVEYKLQLVSPGERRFEHLVTQLKWRCVSGGGTAIYIIGARDDGALVGLRRDKLKESLRTLAAMAERAKATVTVRKMMKLAGGRAVAEICVTQMSDSQQTTELRIAVMGANEAGKSTLIGVLTQGELDNGRGSARLNMFRHVHEVRSGRTSSLSHEILGFDKQGNVVNYGCCSLMTAARIGAVSERLVSLLDQPGHSKYLRTAIRGLSGYEPHYCVIVISATQGITPITEEHLSIVQALNVPYFIVVNKCDLSPSSAAVLARTTVADKKLVLVTDDSDSCQSDKSNDCDKSSHDEDVIRVFSVSCVTGAGLDLLREHLRTLPLPVVRYHTQERCEFQIDEIFHVGENGSIVGGLLAEGQIFEGDELVIGPLEDGSFAPIRVASIYRNRSRCALVSGPHSASLRLISVSPFTPRPGHVLLQKPADKSSCDTPHTQINKLKTKLSALNKQQKNKKNYRRKHKNNRKETEVESESETAECARETEIDGARETEFSDLILEDPNDPRGCIYFQARVQVLRHASAICPGFQCTVHVGNVRQTAVIEGILSRDGTLRLGESASVVFRFVRCPELLRRGRRLLLTQGLATRKPTIHTAPCAQDGSRNKNRDSNRHSESVTHTNVTVYLRHMYGHSHN